MNKKFTLNVAIIFTLLLGSIPSYVFPERVAEAAEETMKEYEIYPVPHDITYTKGNVDLSGDIQVIYDETIDQVTKDKVNEIFKENNLNEPTIATEVADDKVNLMIGTFESGGPVDQYVAEEFATSEMDFEKIDAHHVVVKDDVISILGKDTDASFYGLVSLETMLKQETDSVVNNVEIKDYANTHVRGFIEGYYGIPWSNDSRKELMKFAGQFKATSYIFAPKDDPYHREKWGEPYPEEELDEIRKMAEVGNQTKTQFVWTISPLGEVAQIARTQGQDAAMDLLEENTEKMLYKFDQLYDVGVRQFGVLGDDVGALPLDYVVELMASVSEWAEEKGDIYDTLYTPAAYNSSWAWDGGRELNRLEEGFADNIHILWTGENTVGEVEQFTIDRFKNRDNNGVERRDPLFWLNWPVNDVDMSRVFLGKGSMLHPNIKNLAGVVTNPMQEAEASKVAIFAIADYAWNTETFNAAKSWEDSMKYIEPDATEAFYTLAKHMSDAHPGGISLEESENIKGLLEKVSGQLDNNESIQGTAPELIEELQIIADDADYFLENTKNNQLKEELDPFIKALRDMVLAGIEFLKADMTIETGDKAELWNRYSEAIELRERSLNYDRPMLEGTMKAVPAAKRLQPFVDNLEEKVTKKIESGLNITVEERKASIFTNINEYLDVKLTEEIDSSSINQAGEIALDNNEYIGVKLSRVKELEAIKAPEVEGLTIETSINGTEWDEVKDREDLNIGRYVRLINKGTDTVTFNLDILEISSNEVEKRSVHQTNLTFWESDAMGLIDGKLNTSMWTDQPQTKGQYVTYDLGQVIPIDNLKLYVNEGEGDYPRHAIVESSVDGEDWKTIMTIGNQDGPNEGEEAGTDRIEELFDSLEVPHRYAESSDIGEDARYLRFKITQTKKGVDNWLKAQELVINDGELFPEVNDPTITSTSTAKIGYGVNNINDGQLTSVFRPNGSSAGEILYHVGEVEMDINDITILENPNNLSEGTISVRTLDGWQDIGVMDSGYKNIDTRSIGQILDLKISWGEGKTPAIHEIQLNKSSVSDINKDALEAVIADAEGKDEADYTSESWSPFADALAIAKALQADDDATQEEIDEAVGALVTALEGLEEIEEPVKPEPVDKTALAAAIADAEDKDEADYTSESWSPFADALAIAEALQADDDATQEEIDEAVGALVAALEGLEEVEEPTKPGKPGNEGSDNDDQNPENDQNGNVTIEPDDEDKDKEDGNKLPQTATNIFNFLAVGLVVLLVGIVLIFVRRKSDKS